MYNVIGMWKTKTGFTLVELLVVMGITAIMAAGMISLIGQGPQKYGRDSRRKADLETIRSALEMYRQDNGSYPNQTLVNWKTVLVGGKYIQAVPVDPKNNEYSYSCADFSCKTYNLCSFNMETTQPGSDPDHYCTTNP